jgi:hypothetical protein
MRCMSVHGLQHMLANVSSMYQWLQAPAVPVPYCGGAALERYWMGTPLLQPLLHLERCRNGADGYGCSHCPCPMQCVACSLPLSTDPASSHDWSFTNTMESTATIDSQGGSVTSVPLNFPTLALRRPPLHRS